MNIADTGGIDDVYLSKFYNESYKLYSLPFQSCSFFMHEEIGARSTSIKEITVSRYRNFRFNSCEMAVRVVKTGFDAEDKIVCYC
jgi:hypothetical protein